VPMPKPAITVDPAVWLVIGAGVAMGFGILKDIVVDYLKQRRAPTAAPAQGGNHGNGVPRARNGYMTLADITAHCEKQHLNYQQIMETGFKSIVEQVNRRLNRGDQQFSEISSQLKTHAGALKQVAGAVKAIERKLRPPEPDINQD